jgi:hypothetical protein
MRKSLRSISFVCASLLISDLSQAQDGFAYAVTDMAQQTSNWSFLRKLDLKTGQYSDILLNGTDQSITAFDASTRKQLAQPLTDARYGQLANAAFGTGVAAIAYDKRNNRLYYTPMFIDQLRYIDLKTMKVYYVTDEAFTNKPVKSSDQGNIVTRMTLASDGNGYAMTNDAMQLIQFGTGKKTAIIDLGAIADDQANKNVSIHSSCSSYGGDMIADDNGNLYVFSARNNVFKINIETRVATHIGTISGLPANFTVNGAAVNADNKVLVGSATVVGSYFTVDMKSLVATPFVVAGGALQSSDLANSNLLATGNRPKITELDLLKTKPVNMDESKINIYPNPVTDNQFVVQFGQLEPGTYTLQVTDVTGRQVIQQVVTISGANQSQLVKLNSASSKSIYQVKVLNAANKAVFSTKLVVQ